MKSNTLFLITLLCLASLSCARIRVEKPAGFAVVKGSHTYKAVSPEGAIYKVRYTANYPLQNLDFWGRALQKQMEGEGYHFVAKQDFTAGKVPGLLFEWAAPYGNEDYLYLTALLVYGKTIAIAEAAAEYNQYNTYRDSILKSLTTIQVR